ncbi:MAG: hypothetical protein Q9168_007103 [Polycauliona sp. 1 TL-2023]
MAFPKIKMYTGDKTSDRCFPWLWFVRLVQMLVTIIVLGITASSASDFSTLSCSVPSKLGFNIAAAVLSFLVLLVLIFSTGPKGVFRLVPWIVWGQLALDLFMLIIWIAAAGVSQYSCSDLCNACPGYDEVWDGNIFCYCSTYYITKRDQSPAPRVLTRSIEERAFRRPTSSKRTAKAAFDSIMVILFAFTSAATIFWIFKNRRSGAATAASNSSPMGNTAQPSGALPPTPTPTPGYKAPDGHATGPINDPTQGTSYPSQQPQPHMQQSGYSEPMQQSTYPTANQQGSAGDYYNQPQGQAQQTTYPPNRAEMPSPPPQQHGVSPISGY